MANQKNLDQIKEALRQAGARWPSEFFSRKGLVEFSGGAFSARHLANLDSLGLGPEGSFHLGRSRVYRKDLAIAWLIARVEA